MIWTIWFAGCKCKKDCICHIWRNQTTNRIRMGNSVEIHVYLLLHRQFLVQVDENIFCEKVKDTVKRFSQVNNDRIVEWLMHIIDNRGDLREWTSKIRWQQNEECLDSLLLQKQYCRNSRNNTSCYCRPPQENGGGAFKKALVRKCLFVACGMRIE